jgi:hypothetical protein
VLDLKQAQEWVVTTKLGSSDKRPGTSSTPTPVLRFYASEMLMSTFVLTAAFYGIFSNNKWSFSIFLTLQGVEPLWNPKPRSQPWIPEHHLILEFAGAALKIRSMNSAGARPRKHVLQK